MKRSAEQMVGPPWPPEAAEALARGIFPNGVPQLVPPPLTMTSGACDGADSLFGAMAKGAGHDVLHVLGPRNEPSEDCAKIEPSVLLNVKDDLLDGPLVGPFFEGACLRRKIPPAGEEGADVEAPYGTLVDWRDSRRNFLQVRGATAVYACAYRMHPSAVTPTLDIGGGTGLASQMYIDRFEPIGPEPASACRLYFYDDGAPGWDGCLKDPKTHRKWNAWDALKSEWVPMEEPPSLPSVPEAGTEASADVLTYAGIGATRLDPDFGVKAIQNLYNAS